MCVLKRSALCCTCMHVSHTELLVQQILKRKWEEEEESLHDGTSTNQSHIMKAEYVTRSVHKYIRSLCIMQ